MTVAVAAIRSHVPTEGVALCPDGTRALTWSADGVFVHDEARSVRIGEPVTQAVAFTDAVWLLRSRRGAIEITAADWRGCPVGEPGELPEVGETFHVAAVGGVVPTAMLHGNGACEVRRTDAGWSTTEIACGLDRPVLLGARTWIERRGARLVRHRGGSDEELSVPVELLLGTTMIGGGLLQGGTLAAIGLRGNTRAHLLVVELRTRRVQRQIRVDHLSDLTIAPATGHAVLLVDGGRRLVVLDVVRNRCLGERELEDPVTRVVVSDNGRRAALLAADGQFEVIDGDELVVPRTVAVVAAPVAIAEDPVAVVEDPVAVVEDPVAVVEEAPPAAEPAPEYVVDEPVAPAPAVAFPAGPLVGLAPREIRSDFSDEDIEPYLAATFELVAAQCNRALARSWDSGRLGGAGELPYADEVDAILSNRSGRASARVTAAEERERRAWTAYRNWTRVGSPHVVLASEFGLSPMAVAVLLVVAAPSLWGELGRVYGVLCNERSRPLCDELLVAQILGAGTRARRELARVLDDDSPLIRHGLVKRGGARRPFCELSVHDAVVSRLAGEDSERTVAGAVIVREADRDLEELRAPREALVALVSALARPLTARAARVVLRGRAGSGRRTLAAALARRANRRLGLIELSPMAETALVEQLEVGLREAHLRGWLPCVSGTDQLGEDPKLVAQVQRTLAAHPGPVILRVGRGARPPLDAGYLTFDFAALADDEREASWRTAFTAAGLDPSPAASLAQRYDVGPGVIAQVVGHVAGQVDATDAPAIASAVDLALRQHRAARISSVADRIDRLATWDRLILPADITTSLRGFCDRVRHRSRVLGRCGMDKILPTSRGLTALLQGAPGTGKTLVAGVIARELGYELYRVDLSKVMSKWIGETEKNLAAVFDAAEDGEMVLLFDEADSLFARRTEVRSSNDKHANVEVNYLLQRLDSFEGVAVLTTNFGTAIDDAFRRRVSLRLTLPFPDDELRVRLWRAHLPPQLLANDLRLDALAARYQMSGGYVRNAALRAAYLATSRGTLIDAALLEEAVRTEYLEADRLEASGVLQ